MNKFKTLNHKFVLRAIFIEYDDPKYEFQPLYTLDDEDRDGYPSLYRLYMELSDPTEYKFVKKYLGGWRHWQQLCECDWFKPHILAWREEIELKLRSEALSNILLESNNPNAKNTFSANKFLIEGSWNKNSVGRPTNEKIKQEANKIFESSQLKEHELSLLSTPELSLRIRN